MPYSTLAEEDALIASLGVPMQVWTSVQGRPVRCLHFGTGPVLLLVVGAQHGNEVPGREGALLWVQELASNPPAVLDTWSVLVAPTANPDGVDALTRENASGVDLNRDHIQLTQPETRGMARILGEHRPLVVLDLHLAGIAQDAGLQSGEFPGVHGTVVARTDAVMASLTTYLTGLGYTVGAWPGAEIETLLHFRSALENSVGVVVEIDTTPPDADRIQLGLDACRGMLAVATAQAQDLAADRATADTTPITVLDVRVATVDPAPAGYRLLDVPAEHVDGFGLSGVTALDRPVIGYVLDPAAEYSLPAAPDLEAPMRYSHTVTFSASGVFRPADHPGLVAVEVECKGGSGGGAGAAATGAGEHSGGGGGGGGEYRRAWLTDLAAEVPVTVGAGGAGGTTHGANGTSSTFSTVTAKAGIGGFHFAPAMAVGVVSGGEGGWGGTGGLSIPGGAGSQYVGAPGSACGGIGGSSHLGGGGRASTTTNHQPGRAYGGGGGGAASSQNQPAKTGGAGAPGLVRVHVYVEE